MKNEIVMGIKAIPIIFKNIYTINSSKNKKKYAQLKELKDVHKGERCFLVGTGPSLSIKSVNSLKDETVFLCNYGITMCDKLCFNPDYYVVVDKTCYSDIKPYLNLDHVKTPIVVDMIDDKGGIEELRDNKNWLHLPGYRSYFYIERALNKKWSFSYDVSKCVFAGGSVIYYCYQLAVYMGFSEIYLLGMDCDFGSDKQHFVSLNKEIDNRLKKHSNWYSNTFLKMHSCAKHFCDKKNIKIYNATDGGKLEIFERKSLEEILNNG